MQQNVDIPIYNSLVEEFGNVPEAVRKVAEQTLETARAAVDFRLPPVRRDLPRPR